MQSGQPGSKHRAGPLNHVSNKTNFKRDVSPSNGPLSELNSSKPLIKLLKRTIMCYSAAPSTTNQNATQRIYIKDIKWLGNPYRHTILKMQYECVFKSDRLFMIYLPSLYCSCYCSKCSEDGCSGYWYWGPLVAQRLL